MRKLFAMLAAGLLLTLANGCGRRDAAEKRLNGQLKMLRSACDFYNRRLIFSVLGVFFVK